MKIEKTMKEASVPSEFFYYENAGHAFMNEGEEGTRLRNGKSGSCLGWEEMLCVGSPGIATSARRSPGRSVETLNAFLH